MRTRSALAIVMGLCALSCHSNARPTFVGFEVWTVTQIGSLPAVGTRLIASSPDVTVSLRPDSYYVLRGQFRTPDRADRCLFRPVQFSWHVPDPFLEHAVPFLCLPETGGVLTREIYVDTSRQDVAKSQAAGIAPEFLFNIREYDVASESVLYEARC